MRPAALSCWRLSSSRSLSRCVPHLVVSSCLFVVLPSATSAPPGKERTSPSGRQPGGSLVRCEPPDPHHGLFLVCSAANVNVAVVVALWNPSPLDNGKSALKQSVSLTPAFSVRSPAWLPWALSPMSLPAVESRSPV